MPASDIDFPYRASIPNCGKPPCRATPGAAGDATAPFSLEGRGTGEVERAQALTCACGATAPLPGPRRYHQRHHRGRRRRKHVQERNRLLRWYGRLRVMSASPRFAINSACMLSQSGWGFDFLLTEVLWQVPTTDPASLPGFAQGGMS